MEYELAVTEAECGGGNLYFQKPYKVCLAALQFPELMAEPHQMGHS